MISVDQVKRPRTTNGSREAAARLPAIGLEAEFSTVVDGVVQKPEDVFGSPKRVVRGPLVHRTGRSYHLPTGGALYFDTGVMELATPMIEIDQGCGARGTRSLWESVGFLRAELDAWEVATRRTIRLVGFSAHYNVSFDAPTCARADERCVESLAYLLTHVLAVPVMLLAANRRSTGVGVRPRGNRVEITADFTPDPALMAATATLIVGIVREVMTWPSYSIDQLAAHRLPVVRGFVPVPHSSRKGWVAKDSSFPTNPFTADIDREQWTIISGERVSLRMMGERTTKHFWSAIRALGDRRSLQLIADVMRGRASSLLDLDDRPTSYEDVGRLCAWNDLFPTTQLSRSRYERVLGHVIAGQAVRIGRTWHKPVGVRGWTQVVFRREHDGARRVHSLDEMLPHLADWDRTAQRRVHERRSAVAQKRVPERRLAERRNDAAELAELPVTMETREASGGLEVVAISAAKESQPPPPKPRTPKAESPLVIVARF
ncbi:MAG: hypothetical protein ABI969_14770 [bacterium]